MTTDLLSPLDLAFWHIESDGHPMHLGALGVFTAHSAAAADQAADLLAARSAGVPQLRRRIRDVWLPVGGAAWKPDPGFSPQHHVHLVRPAGADPHTVAGMLMQRPLDRARPPWEAHVIAGPDDTSFAVLFKFHHALADGLRALALAAALFDGAPPAERPRPPRAPQPQEAATTGFPIPLLDPRRLPGAIRGRMGDAMGDIGQALDIGAAVARANWPVRGTGALTAPAGGTRRMAAVAFDLDDVHRVRKVSGGTVNDVLIAVVAGGLRRWLEGRGESSSELAPRALIPVSRRRPGSAPGAGNRLSGYLVRLPVSDPEPLSRLATVRAAMDRNKDAGPSRGAGAVALLADHVPPLGHRLGGPVVAQAARLLFDILVTSVPLPGVNLSLGGSTLREVYPLAPLARGQSLAVAVSTYRGTVHYGLIADGEAVPDLDDLAAAITAELAALREAAEAVP
ncbi:wax ester/triacylglycerol synthase family O-acyltransferase [Streptomyces sp. A3M-1-3]|uniref:wax ester/triacylglycerol synthase family O-acyltransferase n=1 Tax=Streptomyces sp. A3M-1-3 TaxID=2962044 RepID=UPI0020B70EFE|nr:wax ester/triacylglycerol synthase family O-acyltransferase [Streptomyces sp. A3M-1-3]MCP3818736.1 wax ester/triacylglycerol synthase family O-acyltransferase [Streptomyces sp. A3M-1-3]